MSKRRLTVAGALAVAILAACTTTYPVVGKFSDHNEVFLGTVNADLMKGEGLIEARGKNTGIKCHGLSRVIYIPTSNYVAGMFMIPYCAGQRGIAVLRCDDGRRLEADWEATSCTSGHGSGDDNRGARFEFAFGMTEQEAAQKLGIYQEEVSSKPDLPVYRPREVRRKKGFAVGTGFFISADGYLLTNHHVVEGSTKLSLMIDGSEHSASLVRSDAEHDFALLKIEGTFVPVPLGTTTSISRADEVFTLGYPLITLQGNAQKATFGHVNALTGLGDDSNFLQIDVPIQPGNSGGPLFSRQGNVVGITTATLNQAVALREAGQLPQNVNFAAKIDLARSMLADVRTLGPVSGGPSLQELVRTYEKSVVLVIAR